MVLFHWYSILYFLALFIITLAFSRYFQHPTYSHHVFTISHTATDFKREYPTAFDPFERKYNMLFWLLSNLLSLSVILMLVNTTDLFLPGLDIAWSKIYIVRNPIIISTIIPVIMASGCISFFLCWYQLGFGEKVKERHEAIEMGAVEQERENEISEALVDVEEKPTKEEVEENDNVIEEDAGRRRKRSLRLLWMVMRSQQRRRMHLSRRRRMRSLKLLWMVMRSQQRM